MAGLRRQVGIKMARLIVALDFPDMYSAMGLATSLAGTVQWLKVGLELFIASGPQIVYALKELDFRVFLDLKFYDIPNTVARATLAAASLNVDMLTLHIQGGAKMCAAAREALNTRESRSLLMGVTALTSFGPGEMPGIQASPGEYGTFLADCAAAWQLDGVVCSAWEAAAIKKAQPGLLCVCPGIRPAGYKMDDQQRVMNPREAAAAGADFIVVGRPVARAADPRGAARMICDEITT